MGLFYKTTETWVPGSTTLPGEYFTSCDIFRKEMERIFTQSWLVAGRIEEIPQAGNYFLVDIGQESILLVRDHQGKVNAFYNVCRHRGTRICVQESGQFPASIQCPYHAWTYGLDGELIGAPLMDEVTGFQRSAYPLRRAGLQEWEGFLLVNLSDQSAPFDRSFDSVIDKFSAWDLSHLRTVKRMVYDVKANWKLIVQNYSECYHCPKIHPDLSRRSPYRSGQNDLVQGPFLGGFMELDGEYDSLTMSGRLCAVPLKGVSGKDLRRVYYYTFFPATFLSLHPDYVMVHTLWPKGPAETTVRCEWLFNPGDNELAGFRPEDAIGFWDRINRQDWHVCELSQLGVSSRAYKPGPYATSESLLAAFDREVIQALQG